MDDNLVMLNKFILMNLYHEFSMGRLSVLDYYIQRANAKRFYNM